MNPAERRQAELLASYQEAIARDPQAMPPPGLDPELVTVAGEVAAALHTPAPDAAFLDQLAAELGLAGQTTLAHHNGQAPAAAASVAPLARQGWRRTRPDRAKVRQTAAHDGTTPTERIAHQRAHTPPAGVRGAFTTLGYLIVLLGLGGGAFLIFRGLPAVPTTATATVQNVASTAVRQPVGTPDVAPTPSPHATPIIDPATPPATTAIWETTGERTLDPTYNFARMGNYVDRWPQFAPDGRSVAYVPLVDNYTASRLLIADVTSASTRDITPGQGYRYTGVRWSPDGSRLMIVRDQPGGGQTGPAPSEVLILNADGAGMRVLYRAEFLLGGHWSADGQYLEIGGTVFGGLGTNLRVRVADGAVEEVPAATGEAFATLMRQECGLDPAAKVEDVVKGGREPQSKAFRICAVRYSALLPELRATIPLVTTPLERTNALIYYDRATGQRRILLTGIDANTFDLSANARWLFYATLAPQGSPDGEGPSRLTLLDLTTGRAVPIGGEPFNIVQNSAFRWTDDGRAYFVALPTTAVNHLTGYLYELDGTTGQVRLVTRAWQIADVFGVAPDGRWLLTNQPAGQPTSGYALHLVGLAPTGVPRSTATPTPTISPAQAVAPEEALATARAFMEARLHGDRAGALTYLAPALQQAPPDSLVDDGTRWGDKYFIVDQRRDATGRVMITIQIPGPGGEFEQQFSLDQRDGRWLVVELEPMIRLFGG